MTSANPCAVYNFYNCCDCDSSPAADGGTSPSLFVWQSGNLLDPHSTAPTGSQEPLTPTFYHGNSPNPGLKAYLGLAPLHRKAQLKEISLLRFADEVSGAAFTAPISFDLVILDYSGAVVRKISTVTLDYRIVPVGKWTAITLSTAAGELDVAPGEVVAGQLTFGAALPKGGSYSAVYQLSGTAAFIP